MRIDVKYKPNKAVVEKYEINKGMEDGLATLTDLVTNAHVFSDKIVKIETEKGTMCPYIKQKRGRTFINEGDYIIFEEDGRKHVVSEENLWNRFERI